MLLFSLKVKNFGVNYIDAYRKFVSFFIKTIPIPLTTQSQCSVLYKITNRSTLRIINCNVGNIPWVSYFVLDRGHIIMPIIVRTKDLWCDLNGRVNGLF